MQKPVSPKQSDYPNYQCYLDAYDEYEASHERYCAWLASWPVVARWHKSLAAELEAMQRRDEEDELLAYASLQALKRDQWCERVRRAIEDDS